MACDPECLEKIEKLECKVSKLDKDIQTLWDNNFDNSESLPRKTLVFLSDQGTAAHADVISAAAVINLINADSTKELIGVLFGGDNNYPDGEYGTLGANWALFDSYVTAKKAFPALGNHDLDNTGTPGQPQFDKFAYLDDYGSNRRYYHVPFDDADIDLFVLNSGTDSTPAIVEADGIATGETQYDWFVSAIANSTNKFKIVMFHHPFSTVETAAVYPRFVTDMDWSFEQLGVDLILNGHTHADFHIKKLDLPAGIQFCHIVNCSGVHATKRNIDASPIYGVNSGCQLVWHYGDSLGAAPTYGHILVIEKYRNQLLCSFKNVNSQLSSHAFIIEK